MRQARHFAAHFVAGADADVRDVVVLLVSELVSNAVLHSGPHAPRATVGLAIAVVADHVRIEVDDAGANLPVVGDGALDRLTGRGLLLVQSLAARWGCERSDVGKVVWAEVGLVTATSAGDPAAMASAAGDPHG